MVVLQIKQGARVRMVDMFLEQAKMVKELT
jgi:hypothetical protein